jgi:hypothetical protein
MLSGLLGSMPPSIPDIASVRPRSMASRSIVIPRA